MHFKCKQNVTSGLVLGNTPWQACLCEVAEGICGSSFHYTLLLKRIHSMLLPNWSDEFPSSAQILRTNLLMRDQHPAPSEVLRGQPSYSFSCWGGGGVG